MGKFIASLLRQRYYLYSPMHLSYFTEDSLRSLLMRIFPEACMINIFPSPAMKADLRTLVKWLRLPLAIHSKLNIQIPFGYSASLIAIVRTGRGDGD
jgi:hypothetical protein